MKDGKRDFDKAAATWDEEPARVKPARDVGDAVGKAAPLTSDKDTASLLRSFSEVTAPGGHVCIADQDEGKFYSDHAGVFHFGFNRMELRNDFIEAGFEEIRDRTAARVVKPGNDGIKREFTIFLMTGTKRT